MSSDPNDIAPAAGPDSPAGPGPVPGAEATAAGPPPSDAATSVAPAAPQANRQRPVTIGLIAINVLVFAFMVLRGASVTEPTAAQIREFGANWGPLTLGSEPWRLLAANYVHVGILHLAVNMWSLWAIGLLAEQLYRPVTYVLVYTLCGLAGSLASVWWNPLNTSAGASGAIFGLVGALIATLYLGNFAIDPKAKESTVFSLVRVVVINLCIGAAAKQIDNSAHIGGLVAGLALGAALARHVAGPRALQLKWRRGAFTAAAIALLAGFVFVENSRGYVVYLLQGDDAGRAGNYDEAAHALEIADQKKPDDPDILALLASAYIGLGNYPKAESILQRVLQINPKDFDSQYDLGTVQIKLGQYDQAIASFNKAAELDPNDTHVQPALAEARRLSNRADDPPVP